MRWRNGLLTASSALLLGGLRRRAQGVRRQQRPRRRASRPSVAALGSRAEADRVARAHARDTCEARDARHALPQRRDRLDRPRSRPRYQEPLTSARQHARLEPARDLRRARSRSRQEAHKPPRTGTTRRARMSRIERDDPSQGGRYRLERPLGHGGMATRLPRARRGAAPSGRDQAPRRAPRRATRPSASASCARRGSRRGSRTRTWSAVYDAGEAEDGRPYIVMEYVPGTTLAELGRVRAATRRSSSRSRPAAASRTRTPPGSCTGT